jgi:hypothetical protein
MEQNDYKALLDAANLACYKGGDFMTIVDKWKSFLRGHHFIDLPSDCTLFEVDQKDWYLMGNVSLFILSESVGDMQGHQL